MKEKHRIILSNIFFKNYCLFESPIATKESPLNVLKYSCYVDIMFSSYLVKKANDRQKLRLNMNKNYGIIFSNLVQSIISVVLISLERNCHFKVRKQRSDFK